MALRFRKMLALAKRAEHRALLRLTTLGHLAYYGLVSFEAHGHYRYAAGALGVLLIAEALLNHDAPGGDA